MKLGPVAPHARRQVLPHARPRVAAWWHLLDSKLGERHLQGPNANSLVGHARIVARSAGHCQTGDDSVLSAHMDGPSANMVIPNLWQGSRPPVDRRTVVGADVLVLCAVEYQPASGQFPRCRVLRARMKDALPTPREVAEAVMAAREVATAVQHGKCVLVTCMAGLNRSGLVTGLALRHLGWSGKDAVRAIQRARGDFALSNQHFRSIVEGI